MELINFYRESKIERDKIEDFFYSRREQDSPYPSNSIECLSYYILNMTINVIAYSASYLEDEEEICYKCIYHRMDMARRAITRYLIIETEDKGAYVPVLLEAREKLNEWCKYMNQTFDMRCEEEHVHIKNPDYALIQLEKDEDEDED